MRVIRETGEPVRREVAKLSDRDVSKLQEVNHLFRILCSTRENEVVLDEMEASGEQRPKSF